MSVRGTPSHELKSLGNAVATLVIGPSLREVADRLEARTGVPTYRLAHLYGLAATDALALALHEIAGTRVPDRLECQRAQLLAAMGDTPVLRVGIAASPDQLNGLCDFVREIGSTVVAGVAPADGPALTKLSIEQLRIGDAEDLMHVARENDAQVLIGSRHAVPDAEHSVIPTLRCGFPLPEINGGHQETFVGYLGACQMLFDLNKLSRTRKTQDESVVVGAVHRRPSARKLTEYPATIRSSS
jgi:nitrogenase molybdenum-iron protein NifN